MALGRSQPEEWFSIPTDSDTVSYHTQRQRILTPGEIAHLPRSRALLLTTADWGLITLTPFHQHQPWATIARDE